MNVPDRFLEWVGAATIAILGGAIVAIRRWISMLHKHEQQIALLQQNSTHQQETNTAVLRAIGEVRDVQEANRKEAAERLDSLKMEIRDDIGHLISLIRK